MAARAMKNLLLSLTFYCLVAAALAAPVADPEDPELAGGFFEGDMELEVDRNGVISQAKRWPDWTVFYKIDEVFDAAHAKHIRRAMDKIEEVSCIRFHPAPEDETRYLLFIGEPSGCHTKVGFQNKLHTLNLQIYVLDSGCFRLGTIMHEIMHALGFHHQQSAWDRDEYVQIVEENIKEGKEHNFKKYDADTVTDFGIGYDYGSVMHYSATAFSKNGEKTIVPLLDPNAQIGQRLDLSLADIDKLNMMYKCPVNI